MTIPLSPLETRALSLLITWGLSPIPTGEGQGETNWPLMRKLADALEEVAESHYQLGLEAPRNPGRKEER